MSNVDFGSLDQSLVAILGLSPPPFVRSEEAFRQLNFIEHYVRQLGAQSYGFESHYIDRDYMEDYGLFYSRSFTPTPNACQRIHFFSAEPAAVQAKIGSLVTLGFTSGEESFRQQCAAFSRNTYIGFCVIRPLAGSPVGRTVLRVEANTEGGFRRVMTGTRPYTTHLAGAELTVEGLAFQQQDMGVSACATTAIWSSLQKARQHEDIAAGTPGQITTLATKFYLSFGRAMPSEGLSVGQMCNAIQSIGLSPNLIRASHFDTARSCLYSAVMSGFTPILILQSSDMQTYHAVATTGGKLKAPSMPALLRADLYDRAGDLEAVYIHDDRNGPYLLAQLVRQKEELALEIGWWGSLAGKKKETWLLSHILIPLHLKVRLSVADLREIGMQLGQAVQVFRDIYLVSEDDSLAKAPPAVTFELLVQRSHKYTEELFLGDTPIAESSFERFRYEARLPRYVGIVRIQSSFAGTFDVLLDTTATLRTVSCLGFVARKDKTRYTHALLQELAAEYGSKSSPVPIID